jgi:predicted HTH transcriptional regulator
MKAEKGKTIQYIKEKRLVPQQNREKLKAFNKVKKDILGALKKDSKMTIPQLSEKLSISSSDTVYYLMSLLKYGFVETTGLDDMDEYYYYKLKNNG